MIAPERPSGATIIDALIEAKKEMQRVVKSGNNTYDEYRYAKLEDYIDASDEALLKHGLVLLSSVDEIIHLEDRTTKNGGKEHCVRVKLNMTLRHVSGEIIETTCFGEGQDRADKSLYKAVTGGRKYGLACMFNLATKDDPESDTTVGRTKPPRERTTGINDSSPPRQQQSTKPPCPKCGKPDFVLQDREDATKFFCWKKPEKNKLGCGNRWQVGADSEPPATGGAGESQSDPKVMADIIGLIAKATDLDRIAKLAEYIDKKRTAGLLMPKDADLLTAQVEAKDKLIRSQEPQTAGAGF